MVSYGIILLSIYIVYTNYIVSPAVFKVRKWGLQKRGLQKPRVNGYCKIIESLLQVSCGKPNCSSA